MSDLEPGGAEMSSRASRGTAAEIVQYTKGKIGAQIDFADDLNEPRQCPPSPYYYFLPKQDNERACLRENSKRENDLFKIQQ